MLRFFIIASILFFSVACSKSIKQQKALKLLEQVQTAEAKYGPSGPEIKDSLFIRECINKLGKAIQLDAKNSILYAKQVSLLLKLNETEKAIHTLQLGVGVIPEYVEGMTGIGFLYEKQGDHKMAAQYYLMALDVYNKMERIAFNDQINRSLLILLTNNEQTAIEALDQINWENEKQKNIILFWKERYSNFDREYFIYNVLN